MRRLMVVTAFVLGFVGPAAAVGTEQTTVILDPPPHVVAALRVQRGDPVVLVAAGDRGLDLLRWKGGGDPSGKVVGTFSVGRRRLFAWCVAGDGDRAQQVYVLTDGGVVLAWDGKDEPKTVLAGSAAHLPRGIYHLQFVRDLDGDGLLDLVIPLVDGLRLYFGGADGMKKGPSVRHRVTIELEVDDAESAAPKVRQRVTIPRFDVEDQNGDGHPDLVFRDADHVQFFWSRADGSLPEQPTFDLDLEKIRSLLPPRSRDLIDTSNLLRALESQVSFVSRDLNGDGRFDLLLRRGRKVSIYRGGPTGIDRTTAAQVLKTGGNLLAAFAVDDDGDGRDDLCMLRVADVSLGQVLLWLVAGGKITLDLFVYGQEQDLRFSRKPVKRRTLEISIPSAASLVAHFEERMGKIEQEFQRVPVSGDFDGDGSRDDVVRLGEKHRVEVYRDLVSSEIRWSRETAWHDVMRRFDEEATGHQPLEVDLEDLIDWAPLPGRGLERLSRGRDPDRVVTVGEGEEASGARTSAYVFDADGDGRDDVVLAVRNGADGPTKLVILCGLLPR